MTKAQISIIREKAIFCMVLNNIDEMTAISIANQLVVLLENK